jgi:hypothetical protein
VGYLEAFACAKMLWYQRTDVNIRMETSKSNACLKIYEVLIIKGCLANRCNQNFCPGFQTGVKK